MDLINEIMKVFSVTTISYLFFNKIKPSSFSIRKKVLLGVGFVIITSTTFLILGNFIGEPYKTAIVIIGTSIFISLFLRERI